MSAPRELVVIGELADDLASQQPLVTVDVTEYEAQVIAAHQRESALRGIHEAGHVVAAAVLGVRVKSADISIRHTGETTLGWNDETEVGFITASRMNQLVVISLAGMEAEQHFLGELTDGGSGDMLEATNRCLEMIAAGMEPAIALSHRAFGGYQGPPHPQWLTDQIAKSVDERMRHARQQAAELVRQRAEQILGIARLLVAAPQRRLADDRLAGALRAVGIDPPAAAQPVGGARRSRRRRRR